MIHRDTDSAAQLRTKRLRFGSYILDVNRGCLLLDGSEIALRPKTFAVARFNLDVQHLLTLLATTRIDALVTFFLDECQLCRTAFRKDEFVKKTSDRTPTAAGRGDTCVQPRVVLRHGSISFVLLRC